MTVNGGRTTSPAASQAISNSKKKHAVYEELNSLDPDNDDGEESGSWDDEDISYYTNEDSNHVSTTFGESSGNHSSTADSESQEKREKRQLEELVRKENISVVMWRETVTGILMIIAFISCVSAFVFMGQEENNTFKSVFSEAANMLSAKFIAESEALAHQAMDKSQLMTASAVNSNSTWPFATFPFFETYLTNIKSDIILLAPLVTEEHRPAWEDYSVANQHWIEQGLALRGTKDDGHARDPIPPYIHGTDLDKPVPYGTGPYAPVWQVSPVPEDTAVVNLDLFTYLQDVAAIFSRSTDGSLTISPTPLISAVVDMDELLHYSEDDHSLHGEDGHEDEHVHENMHVHADGEEHVLGVASDRTPRSLLVAPVYDQLTKKSNPEHVGMLIMSVVWDYFFQNVLSETTVGIQCIIRNTCDPEKPQIYMVDGPDNVYVGDDERLIDTFYSDMEVVAVSSAFATENHGGCSYSLHIIPTRELRSSVNSNDKVIYTLVVAALFVVIWIVFRLYERSVGKRNEKILATATKSSLILSSLFPETVKNRLFQEENGNKKDKNAGAGALFDAGGGIGGDKPLADFFPEASVLFADIVGFTAWSSVREPSQVFILLETIYAQFDAIAKRRRIFKIETIGDCYVATAGLPEPRMDHPVAMARFADECLTKMHQLVARLEETLGPDTGDLSMRFGFHSGPVTAGVLRGDRARFQLFGDTVNTAARMESTGQRGRIHISEQSAQLLTKLGKGKWVVPREDKVNAKGKGLLKTYWVQMHSGSSSGDHSSEMETTSNHTRNDDIMDRQGSFQQPNQTARVNLDKKTTRLVNWNVEILQVLLKQILARRKSSKKSLFSSTLVGMDEKAIDKKLRKGKMVINEVAEIISLPKFDETAARAQEDANDAVISEEVLEELREYVGTIALSYKANPFHNFEHASHVTMSVSKLLSRIVAPSSAMKRQETMDDRLLHDHTYGITSDPLTQFACVFSALIHDAEHDGVPNAQLIKEETELALHYKNQSVAEQNSVDVAWALLLEDRFQHLRNAIYTCEDEMIHFRKLVVNCVMATDICDKNLKELRNKRWDRAFAESEKDENQEEHPSSHFEDDVNRKATIVIEHLLQASDVSHTMQHWHVFRKWNEKLFNEMYVAYREGRAEKDPSLFWYKGEIGFFDFYVIPLAKKLSQCGVFGVSSDEYLNYAESNRNEWEERGEAAVKEMYAKAIENYEEKLKERGGADGSKSKAAAHPESEKGATRSTRRSSYNSSAPVAPPEDFLNFSSADLDSSEVIDVDAVDFDLKHKESPTKRERALSYVSDDGSIEV